MENEKQDEMTATEQIRVLDYALETAGNYEILNDDILDQLGRVNEKTVDAGAEIANIAKLKKEFK